jgi:NAD+ kinase
VLVLAHTGRPEAVSAAEELVTRLDAAGVAPMLLPEESAKLPEAAQRVILPADEDEPLDGAELVVVLGGDGTILRAAEIVRGSDVPLLGVNLGHVGFLAETEPQALADSVAALAAGRYTVEERVTIDAEVVLDGVTADRTWALNEVSLERTNRSRMLEIAVAVDERPLLRFGCDGMLCATPTGSTAYAFSVGGPIVWPNVDAMLLVPNAAHALFSRPIVVAPDSVIDVDLVSREHEAILSCDGRRTLPVPAGARIRARKGRQSVKVIRLGQTTFPDRLVSKFQLPVRSLREASPPPVGE